jgi:hypothetical protein
VARTRRKFSPHPEERPQGASRRMATCNGIATAMTQRFDFANQDYLRDPAAGLARLRAAGALVDVRFPIIGKVWITTTQEMASRVLKDSATFTLRQEGGAVAGLRWWMPGMIRTLADNMLTMDEPDHTRLRSIVDEAFRRRAILDMEPHILKLADDLAARLFADGSPADLVERYARQLPLSVICELLGLPPDDRPTFIAWTKNLTRITGMMGWLVRLFPALVSMRRYLERRLEVVRKQGGEGLIAEIVRVEKEGQRISAREMVAMVFLLLGAGSETTMHLISGSVFELLSRPCRSPSRALRVTTWSSAACGSRRARRSWPCWRPPTWIRTRTSIRNGSTSNVVPTGIFRLEPASTSVSATSSRASKPNARWKLCSGAGRSSHSPFRRRRSAGVSAPGCGPLQTCRWWRRPDDRVADRPLVFHTFRTSSCVTLGSLGQAPEDEHRVGEHAART